MTADRCMERRQGGSGERLPQQKKVDVHARWKPEREAEEKRIRRGRRGRRRRDEDRAVDQKQLE